MQNKDQKIQETICWQAIQRLNVKKKHFWNEIVRLISTIQILMDHSLKIQHEPDMYHQVIFLQKALTACFQSKLSKQFLGRLIVVLCSTETRQKLLHKIEVNSM